MRVVFLEMAIYIKIFYLERYTLAVCRRERFSLKNSPLEGHFRPKSERWPPLSGVEMAVVRALDFLSDKLLDNYQTFLRVLAVNSQ